MGIVHGNPDLDAALRRAYAAYVNWRASAAVRRTPRELETALIAAGLCAEDAGALFFASLREDWQSGEQDLAPFDGAAGANQEYLYLARLRGLLACCIACESPLARPDALFCTPLCAAAWREQQRHCFTDAPLALPPALHATFVALLAGTPVRREDEAALAHWLDATPAQDLGAAAS